MIMLSCCYSKMMNISGESGLIVIFILKIFKFQVFYIVKWNSLKIYYIVSRIQKPRTG